MVAETVEDVQVTVDSMGRKHDARTGRIMKAERTAEEEASLPISEQRDFTPIVAYNVINPYEAVIVRDDPDPELRPRLHFYAGVHFCQTREEFDALQGKPGVYFDDGSPLQTCPSCKFAIRNTSGFEEHVRRCMS